MDDGNWDKMTLDVASVIIGSLVKRSDGIILRKEKADETPLDRLRRFQSELARLCDEQQGLVDAINDQIKQSDTSHQEILRVEQDKRQNIIKKIGEFTAEIRLQLESMHQLDIEPILEELYKEFAVLKGNYIAALESDSSNTAEIIRLQILVDEKTRELDDLQHRLAENQETCTDLQNLKTQIRDFSTRFKSIETEEVETLDISSFKEEISHLVQELVDAKANMETDMTNMKSAYEMKLKELEECHRAEIEEKCSQLELEKTQRMTALIDENESIVKMLNDANEARVKQLQMELKELLDEKEVKHATVLADRDAEIISLKSRLTGMKQDLESKTAECHRLYERIEILEAEKENLRRNYEAHPSSPPSKKSRTGSVVGEMMKSSITLPSSSNPSAQQVRVVFTGFRDQTGPRSIKHLGGLIEKLGGVVHISDVFSEHITHVVAPKGCTSIKVLAGSLTAKWIVGEDWLLESANAGHFLPEVDFNGKRFTDERPFRGKAFLLSSRFQAQQIRHQFDPSCCKTLIENLGKGKVVKEGPADYTLISDSEPAADKCLILKAFLAMIPGYASSKSD